MTRPGDAAPAVLLSAHAVAAFWSRVKRSTSPEKRPVFLEFRSSNVFVVFVVCLAISTDILAVCNAALFVGSPIAGWYADRAPSVRSGCRCWLTRSAKTSAMPRGT
ncbi:hypothetical protein BT67DRAFT_444939 [Trichocladium antarcticum]|uniref:Uncharacterized protein n=1 Tax=Trichocladium antarcticum TaxID=1450529 RepID=A0AAN6UDS1_9PEZI|nr:hypothetical protein BT67DRAFT_444939 [Trichocladium antarcticum]